MLNNSRLVTVKAPFLLGPGVLNTKLKKILNGGNFTLGLTWDH
jgi:hypothetical protein